MRMIEHSSIQYLAVGHLGLSICVVLFEGLRERNKWISRPRCSGLFLLWSSLGRSWGMIPFQSSLRRAHIWKMPWLGNVCFDNFPETYPWLEPNHGYAKTIKLRENKSTFYIVLSFINSYTTHTVSTTTVFVRLRIYGFWATPVYRFFVIGYVTGRSNGPPPYMYIYIYIYIYIFAFPALFD